MQHFAVYTNQNYSDMTYLLMQLKLYEPEANYSTLPNTGKELVKIDGFDWPRKKEIPAPNNRFGCHKLQHGSASA